MMSIMSSPSVVNMGNYLLWSARSNKMSTSPPPQKRQEVESTGDSKIKNNVTDETVSDENFFICRFKALYNNPYLSDLTLKVGNDLYYAHRFMLITGSDVFGAMLNQPRWLEAKESEIKLMEDPECIEVFDKFLRYFYSGSVLLSTSTVLPVLLLADKYSVDMLRDSCIEYMQRHIVESPDTNRTLTWYQYAKMTEQEGLKSACENFILSNFDVILDVPDWTEMRQVELVEFLKSSALVVKSEFHLWSKIETWLLSDENKDNMEDNLKCILPLIRFTMILPKNLLLIESSPICARYRVFFTDKLNLAYKHHSLMMHCGDNIDTREAYRNYSDDDYCLCFPFKLENFPTLPKIHTRVAVTCQVPIHYTPVASQCSKHQVNFAAYFYPRGHFTTITLYGTYINRQNDLTMLRLNRKFCDMEAMKVDVTLVLYGKKNSVQYVAYSHSSNYVFGKGNSELKIDNVIDFDKLAQEDSAYLVNDDLEGKIFVKIQDIGDHLLATDNQ